MQEYAPTETIPPTHTYAGTSKDRQEVGLPGHCKACAAAGHMAAHPDLGCGDVGCDKAHDDAPASVGAYAILYATLSTTAYAGYTQFNDATAYGETDAHRRAQQISVVHGHASVHHGGDLLFSYMDGVLFTDNRPGRAVWHEAAPATAGRLTAI